MELDSFQLFLNVVRLGSFAAVARQDNVDPSSVSRQIAALEHSLGYRLFDRTTRRLALTEAGQLTFDQIQNPLEELAQIRDAARDVVNQPSGDLRIATSPAFAERWLIPRLTGFRAEFAGINLELVLSDAKTDIIGEGIDLAIRLGDQMAGSFITSKLLATNYRVVASADYLQKYAQCAQPSDLAMYDTIVFPFSGYRSQWRFRKKGGKPEVVDVPGQLVISSALAIRRAVLEGLGVALLADWTIGDDLATGRLTDMFPEYEFSAANFDTAAWILYPSRAYVPVKTRVLIDYLKQTI